MPTLLRVWVAAPVVRRGIRKADWELLREQPRLELREESHRVGLDSLLADVTLGTREEHKLTALLVVRLCKAKRDGTVGFADTEEPVFFRCSVNMNPRAQVSNLRATVRRWQGRLEADVAEDVEWNRRDYLTSREALSVLECNPCSAAFRDDGGIFTLEERCIPGFGVDGCSERCCAACNLPLVVHLAVQLQVEVGECKKAKQA